jgi:hypothetical protein
MFHLSMTTSVAIALGVVLMDTGIKRVHSRRLFLGSIHSKRRELSVHYYRMAPQVISQESVVTT